MKRKEHTINSKKHHNLFIILAALTVLTLSLATGCTSWEEAETEAPPASTPETSVPDKAADTLFIEPGNPSVDHNLDSSPDPVPEEELILSREGYGAIGALSDEDLTLLDMLTYAVEDEYLAHGEYIEIMDRFDVDRPYGNIARSEEMHLSFLSEVYGSYGIPFPEDTSSDHLIIPESLLEAAETGVQAEIDNIAMYEKFMTYDLPENIYTVFEALMKGSESHLLAFQKQVERLK